MSPSSALPPLPLSLAPVFFAFLAISAGAEPLPTLHEQPRLRRPTALALLEGRVYVANRDSGSVSVVDPAAGRVLREIPVGERLSDLAAAPRLGLLLALEESAGSLLVLRARGEEVRLLGRHALPESPRRLTLSPCGNHGAVASRWARQVTLFHLRGDAAEPRVELQPPLDLPFAPHALWFHPAGESLVAADAFGGRLAQIDIAARRVVSLRTLQGNNLRGMATAGKEELLIAHQLLNERVSTTHSRIFWGTVMGNVLRSVSFDDLLAPREAAAAAREDRLEQIGIGHWRLYPLGEPGHGTGDPEAVLTTPTGETLVALAGVNEVALRKSPNQPFVRVAVGKRPVALLALPDGDVLTANQFSDSLSLLNPATGRVEREIPLGPLPELNEAEQGELLFFDARLSLDGWFSCHSCHTDGHTHSLLADTFADGSFGFPKRTPSLLGVGETGPWTWRGARSNLAEQIHTSLNTTMQGEEGKTNTPENARKLAAYLRTLTPPPGVAAARGRVESEAVARGRAVFQKYSCAECHAGPHYTSPERYDVGIHAEGDDDGLEYNPPSLLGVSQRDGFFHDNRSATLRQVFAEERHPNDTRMSPREIDDLLALLESL